MKKFSTILCCMLLAMYGAFIGLNNPAPINTISAEVPTLSLPKDLCRLVHDTVPVTVRDTVYKTKVKHVYKYRKHIVRDTIKSEIPVLYTKSEAHIPDTILESKPKKLRKVIELSGED